ncbi:MAG TPA: response regulator transcription factor [Gammaproteobacteria bacterium]|nr:response regulator transcription factor [Gammaproteobacteria bacterium]
MKILIVDDEPLARSRLAALIAALPDHEVAGEAGNGLQALEQVQALEPDVVLLDIRMPGMDGIEAARHLATLETPPAVIFTTAYDDYALAAFETNALDYLLKPIRRERLAQALDSSHRLTRAQLVALRQSATAGEGVNPADAERGAEARRHISARVKGGLRLVPVEEICFFHADQKYVTVGYLGGEVLIDESLKSLEEEFGERFVRIHRNALVARERIMGLEKDAAGRCCVILRDCDQRLEVSRRHLPGIRKRLR